jgi:hypothetical protein
VSCPRPKRRRMACTRLLGCNPVLRSSVHEFAHLWLGEGGVSNLDEALQPIASDVERWCNTAAAEFLVLAHELRAVWHRAQNDEEPYQFLARRFKVSSVVAARRALDSRLISREVEKAGNQSNDRHGPPTRDWRIGFEPGRCHSQNPRPRGLARGGRHRWPWACPRWGYVRSLLRCGQPQKLSHCSMPSMGSRPSQRF